MAGDASAVSPGAWRRFRANRGWVQALAWFFVGGALIEVYIWSGTGSAWYWKALASGALVILAIPFAFV